MLLRCHLPGPGLLGVAGEGAGAGVSIRVLGSCNEPEPAPWVLLAEVTPTPGSPWQGLDWQLQMS